MLKENWRSIGRIERVFDAAIIVISFFLAHKIRTALPIIADLFNLDYAFSGRTIAPLKDYAILLFVSLGSYLVTLHSQNAYSSMRLRSAGWLFRISFVSSVVAFVSLGTASFMLKIDSSRAFITLHCIIAGFGLQLERSLVLRFLRYWRGKGRNFRNIVICGYGVQASKLIRDISRRPELGIRIRAIANLQVASDGRTIEKITEDTNQFCRRFVDKGLVTHDCCSLIGIESLTAFITELAVDEIVFTDVASVMMSVEEMVSRCSEQGIRTTLVADLFSIGMVRSELSFFGSIPLVHYQTPPGDRWDLSVKRFIDVAVSALLLLVFLPLFSIIAILIKRDTPGPVLYKQKRVGLNGRVFSLYKFRSMQEGAEERLSQLQSSNEMRGPAFKVKNDPRITNVGRLLRRHSLDELPQLWNVLRGDMSLVGPRPPMPHEVRLYDRRERRRLSMRPGLTCTWQVSGRNDICDFDSWVQLDLEYIDNWSLGRDFALLARTIPTVVFGIGAR